MSVNLQAPNNLPMVSPQLIVLDPALVNEPVDHHWSIWQELAQVGRELKQPILTYASRQFELRAEHDVCPFFATDTYIDDSSIDKWLNCPSEIRDEYRSLSIPAGSRVLMHTASPWHLDAIAWKLRQQRDFRLSIGSMLPSTFWSESPTILSAVDDHLRETFAFLQQSNMIIYSETGTYDYLAGSINLPVLLQPMSRKTLAVATGLRQQSARVSDRVKFGFFGQPKISKGFQLAAELVRSLPAGQLHFFLPLGYQDRIGSLNKPNEIIATSKFRSNTDLMRDMASVDVILCFYDPTQYRNQMSGIVVDALLLGKPLLLTAGTQIERFVNTIAPGAAIQADYSISGLREATELPMAVWQTAKQRAAASARVISDLRSGERFFDLVFGPLPLQGGDDRERRSQQVSSLGS